MQTCKETQRFKEVHPKMATSSIVKYYNCVRDKTKGYVFSLGVVFEVCLSEYESSIYTTKYIQ